jgi:hypothetical protein
MDTEESVLYTKRPYEARITTGRFVSIPGVDFGPIDILIFDRIGRFPGPVYQIWHKKSSTFQGTDPASYTLVKLTPGIQPDSVQAQEIMTIEPGQRWQAVRRELQAKMRELYKHDTQDQTQDQTQEKHQ